MSRILIPRGPCGSSKVVASTDFERYFGDALLTDHVICGFTLAVGGGTRSIDVATGNARVLGLHVNNSTSCCDALACLAVCMTHHVYIQVNRDCMCRPCNYTFASNTTGCTPADAFKIGTATTDCTGTTASVTTIGTAKHVAIGSGCAFPTEYNPCTLFWRKDSCSIYQNTGTEACPDFNVVAVPLHAGDEQTYPVCITIGNYTSPCSAASSSDGAANVVVCDSFCTYTTNCEADAVWARNPTCFCRKFNAVNITTDLLEVEIDCAIGESNAVVSVDLGACCLASNSEWLLRFKLDVTCVTQGVNNSNGTLVMGLANSLLFISGNQDFIGMSMSVDCTLNVHSIQDTNNAAPNGAREADFCRALTVETLYAEIIRSSTTDYSGELFCCACYCMS